MSTAVIEAPVNRIATNGAAQRQELSAEQQSFELSQRKATLLSKSSLVPKDFQNNISNCFIAMNMASRLGADVLMVMQNLYIVHGRPGWSSQFLIATFNMSGRFSAMRFEFVGEAGKPSYGCRAWAVEKDTNQRLEGSVITLEMAQKEGWLGKNGSKWQTMPDQMLRYRAASFFVRAYAPEISMGLHTADELEDIDPSQRSNHIASDEPETHVITFASKSEELAAKFAKPKSEPEQTGINWQAFISALGDLTHREDTEAGEISSTLPNGQLLRICEVDPGPSEEISSGATALVIATEPDAVEQVRNIVERAKKSRS